jgi:hypothetical protein
MSDLIVLAIIVAIGWFVMVSGSDPKRDQQRQKLRRQALKYYKENN